MRASFFFDAELANTDLLNRYVFPPEVLRRISSRITNEVPGVNRVTYDISSKPPSVCSYYAVPFYVTDRSYRLLNGYNLMKWTT